MKNGFYVFKPKHAVYTNECDGMLCNGGKQVVEVVRELGKYIVYVTGVDHSYLLEDVKKLGKFKKRIKL